MELTPKDTGSAGREIELRNGSSIAVEVVADPETRAQGLMYRPSLSTDRGMLFIFPDADRHAFWMKNTLIPLDIVWLDEGRAVVHVEKGASPCRVEPCPTYEPAVTAKYVLELSAGQADARAIAVGDVVAFRGGIENIVAR